MISKNDIYECTITGTGSEGEGVAKIDGYTVFVPFTAVGDRLRVRIVKANKNFGFGKIEEILDPSDKRGEAPCTAYGKCGGCNLMHLSYDAQLEYKQKKVSDALKRIGGLDTEVMPVTPSPKIFGYRNKVSVPVSLNGGKIEAGFYAPHSHRTVTCDGCLLQADIFGKIIETVIKHMEKNNIMPYDEITHRGNVRHIYIRRAAKTGETMVSVVSAKGSLPAQDELVSALLSTCPDIKSIIINENRTASNVILGDKCHTIYGGEFIRDILCETEFFIHHNSFYQINSALTELLYAKVSELLGDLKGKTVLDIYCGIGTISLCTAKSAEKIIGIEYVPEAVENAKENARLCNAQNAQFYAGDACEVAVRLAKEGMKADAVILDPPRKGCEERLLSTVCSLAPEKIVYVSCNPATLARDMKYLAQNGYSAGFATPFDMFPNTSHVECVVLMSCNI